jgi:glutamate-ammonia-ligase adenylyltransferase
MPSTCCMRDPQTVQLLGEHAGERRPLEEIRAEMRAVARRHADPGDAVEAVRAVRRRELLRVAAG